MSETLRFPKTKRLRHAHFVGYALVLVGTVMVVAGQRYADGPLAGLFPLFGTIDLLIGVVLISYRREVIVNLDTHTVILRRWVLFPVRKQTFIPGAFDHVDIRGSDKDGYAVHLDGNRTLFVDGPMELRQARQLAEHLGRGTGWQTFERSRKLAGSWRTR